MTTPTEEVGTDRETETHVKPARKLAGGMPRWHPMDKVPQMKGALLLCRKTSTLSKNGRKTERKFCLKVLFESFRIRTKIRVMLSGEGQDLEMGSKVSGNFTFERGKKCWMKPAGLRK